MWSDVSVNSEDLFGVVLTSWSWRDSRTDNLFSLAIFDQHSSPFLHIQSIFCHILGFRSPWPAVLMTLPSLANGNEYQADQYIF